jgi:hypothetical protein
LKALYRNHEHSLLQLRSSQYIPLSNRKALSDTTDRIFWHRHKRNETEPNITNKIGKALLGIQLELKRDSIDGEGHQTAF